MNSNKKAHIAAPLERSHMPTTYDVSLERYTGRGTDAETRIPEDFGPDQSMRGFEETYRNIKRYFIAEGRYTDASWASFKEKTMEKMRLKKARDISYLPVALMGLLCGYGEKPQRIVFSSFFIIFFYALLYYIFKSIHLSA